MTRVVEGPVTEAGLRLVSRHHFVGSRDSDGGYDVSDGSCSECGDDWPCAVAQEAPAIEAAARAEAGHRISEPHDCFLMNCARLGDEVRRLQVQVTEAAQAARAEVIAERDGLDFEALRQAIDSDEFAAEVGVAGAFEHWETVRIAEVIATGYKLALLPPTEPK